MTRNWDLCIAEVARARAGVPVAVKAVAAHQ